MDLFEYQARDMFEKHGVPVLGGVVATTPQEAEAAAVKLGGGTVVVKAQVKTGGRGKAGGVKLAHSPAEAAEKAEQILGMDIKGHTVHRVMVAQGAKIAEEFYFSVLLDRANRNYLAMCSVEGGMEIEQLAVERPEALARVAVDPLVGIDEAKAAEIVAAANFPEELRSDVAKVIQQLWTVFKAEDATLVEVNPLVRTEDGTIIALDGKVTLDDNASEVRHPDHEALEDKASSDPLEAKAKAHGLNYVKLDGAVGIIGNGAGLVMSTLDVVAYAGEKHGGVKPPTSSTSAAAPTPRSWPLGSTSSSMTRRSSRCSSTSSAASPRATRSRRASSGPSRSSARRRTSRWSCVSTATTSSSAARSCARPTTRSSPSPRRWTAVPTRPPSSRTSPPPSEPDFERDHTAMSIYLNKDSRIIVQGITGGMGAKHTALMLDSGATIVGGVNARKAGTTVKHKDHDGNDVTLPVFGTVKEAMAETGANVSVLFVPPAFTKDAAIEAIDAEMPLIVVITEGVPVQDTAEVWAYLQGKKTRMIGPNCPGIITPGESLAGITPHTITGKGPVGLVSKSGTLTYQMMYELRDLGFSTAIGIGGDPIVGTTHIDALEAFENDPETKAIVMIGEIGGDAEERAAAYIKEHVTKPVVGYVAGFTAPEGKTMGHAGAIVSGSAGTAQAKKEALEAVGVRVGKTPSETAALLREVLAAV